MSKLAFCSYVSVIVLECVATICVLMPSIWPSEGIGNK